MAFTERGFNLVTATAPAGTPPWLPRRRPRVTLNPGLRAHAPRGNAGMSRIVWTGAAAGAGSAPTIEVHYQSPHEFVKDLDPGVSPERLFVPTERILAPGSQRALILHVGFVARTLRLNARVEARVGATPRAD